MKFRHAGSALPNMLVISYTLLAWPLGIWLLCRPQAGLNLAGVALTAHSLVYSAYLIHELAHHAIFSTGRDNDRLGKLMSWINGGCVARYAGLKEKHLRHHADRMDVVTFDYRAVVGAMPRWAQKTILLAEWAYIPAIELLMRALVIRHPFTADGRKQDRFRVVSVLTIRLACWLGLAAISVKAVLLYLLSYMIFLTVLRFMDCFQHTYDVYFSPSLAPAPVDPKRDRAYENINTYSNLLSEKYWLLNLLVLNFPYHNAHHARPVEPWYKLPALHRSLYGEGDGQVLPFSALALSFHRHRVSRILAQDYGEVEIGADTAETFLGAVGVSFLTAV